MDSILNGYLFLHWNLLSIFYIKSEWLAVSQLNWDCHGSNCFKTCMIMCMTKTFARVHVLLFDHIIDMTIGKLTFELSAVKLHDDLSSRPAVSDWLWPPCSHSMAERDQDQAWGQLHQPPTHYTRSQCQNIVVQREHGHYQSEPIIHFLSTNDRCNAERGSMESYSRMKTNYKRM